MKAIQSTILFCCITVSQSFCQGVVGKWKTIDDETGDAKSVVEVTERDGKVYGNIVKLFRTPDEDPDPVCDECPADDSRYKKRVIGMEIMTNMLADGDEYGDGNILDPENGKIYKCRIWLEDQNLKVRGYWGPFYRTQTWHRFQ